MGAVEGKKKREILGPSLRGSTVTHTRSKNGSTLDWPKLVLAENWLGQNHDGPKWIGQIRMAKTGLAKVGLFRGDIPKSACTMARRAFGIEDWTGGEE